MALGVAGLWFLVPGLLGTFRTLFATLTGDTSTTSRTSAFSTAMPYISQHPWFGHGFGTFFPATYFFTDDQYLLSLIEIGVVGLIALLALFVTGLVTAQRVRRATNDPETRDLGQCLTATIAVAMVAFGTFDALSFNMAAGLTFLFLGCTGAALRLLKAQGAQADGHLAGQPAMQPDQEPPALAHQPRQDGPDGPGASGALGVAGAPGGLAGRRAGQESNGGQPERQADLYPAQPAEAAPQEPARAQEEQPAKPYWENQLWPWEPQDLQPTETRQEAPAQKRPAGRGASAGASPGGAVGRNAPRGAHPGGAGRAASGASGTARNAHRATCGAVVGCG